MKSVRWNYFVAVMTASLACSAAQNTAKKDHQNKTLNASVEENTKNRIVGGEPIPIAQVPWQIALLDNGRFHCGGSIISSIWVLTAAHCIDNAGRFSVRAGSRFWNSGGQTRRVQRVIKNGGYNRRTQNHDIAMLRLQTPFVIGGNVKPVQLATPKMKQPHFLYASGWGTLNEHSSFQPRILRGVRLELVARNVCENRYGRGQITRYMLCTQGPGKDTCSGDSGGPVVHNGVQYGIVSYGRGCARPYYPGVNVDVGSELTWINIVKRKN